MIIFGAELQIKPYTQWTFDTPIEQVIFLENAPGYPIYMIRTEMFIRIYDEQGEEVRKIQRLVDDRFELNSARTGFMLVHEQELYDSPQTDKLSSFQVFTSQGAPYYTNVHQSNFATGELEYQLTDDLSILITERGKPWLLKMNAEDTLLFLESVSEQVVEGCDPFVLATNLKNAGEVVTASSCIIPDTVSDYTTTDISIWQDGELVETVGRVGGELRSIRNIPDSDYYFLEVDNKTQSSLTLFNRSKLLVTYPWKSWEIRAIDQTQAFVISETDLNVVNLGDGAVSVSYHPIELTGISDAAYMQEWGLFLYLRYQLFFDRDGKQAFRNFILEGVDHSGELVHRSSFGTWSTVLPKISPVGKNKFAIHIHNAVLLYEIELK